MIREHSTQPLNMATATAYNWTGTHVQGSTISAVVKYHGPTDKRCSRWIATLKRGKNDVHRASVSFSDGPMAAALAAATRAGCPHWTVKSVHTIDEDTYCVGFAAC